jgi:uncharacterized protein YjbI with pentapeptide repeats
MTSAETCSYEFDPDRWERVRGRELQLVEDLPTGWSCDRPSEDHEYCLFHRDPEDKSDIDVVERLLQEIEQPLEKNADTPTATAENRFIGARFGGCRLAHRVLQSENNLPIDLRFAHVEGDLNWDRAALENPVRFSGAAVEGNVTLQNAQIGANIDFSDSVIDETFDASDADFTNHVWCIKTAFGEGVTFDRSRIDGDLCLAGAEVGGNLRLASTTIRGNACFSRVSCDGALVVEPKRIDGNVWCVRSVFETFDDAREPNNLLRGGDMGGDIVVRESKFGDKLTLEGIDVDGRFVFTGTTVDSNWVDLTGCSISAGALGQPDGDAYTMYDFTDATVGDVRIRDVHGNGFERVYFKNTTFDGFDFGRHRSALLRTDWTIHTTEEEPSLSAGTESSSLDGIRRRLAAASDTLRWVVGSALNRIPSGVPRKSMNETTYLKAKNGANRIGDSKAAAEFFQKEMTFRRKRHAEVALNGWGRGASTTTTAFDRSVAAGAWVANVGLSVMTGYGEKPHRVLVVSLGTIIAFAAFFAVVPGSTFGGQRTLPDLLLLSFQSFITFVIGSPITADASYAVRLLSAVEGLIGAFLVALSVFALTRSVHR